MKKKLRKREREKLAKKTERRITVNYYCNPQYFVCGETVIPPHGLEYVIMRGWLVMENVFFIFWVFLRLISGKKLIF